MAIDADIATLLNDTASATRAGVSALATHNAKVYIPAQQMTASGTQAGTPTSTTRGYSRVWSMPNGSNSAISGGIAFPSTWLTVDVDVIWVNLGAGTGTVDMRITSTYNSPTLGSNINSGGAITVGPVLGTLPNAGTQNIVTSTRMRTGFDVNDTSVRTWTWDLIRAGTADTLGNAIGVLGVLFTKAS